MTRSGKEVVAVVTGASRGAGKGIAEALGGTGATVYVTGRSQGGGDSSYGGSVHETAEEITRAGGTGIPVVVDHADDAAVAELFMRVRAEHERLDILVNNAATVASPAPGGFWERPLSTADVLTVGLRSHYVAAWHAAPLLIANGRGLIVNTGHYGAVSYHQGPAYGAQKAGADKMAADMAKELHPYGVAALSVWMGGLDTERARAYLESLTQEQRAALPPRESTRFTGCVIAALYASDELMAFTGRTVIGAELGAYLDVTDVDGSRPRSRRHVLGGPPEPHASLRQEES
ncbi:SDR family NAD(P)-dependent oxidoreductase [Streptomyces sp. NPDC057137]|uniref:SDR family NAD(P)-dependent oxidoreductase n=1 Tax=Streptomyces sp. NPDC057137 TaxID=3346030 RepID=UPI0036379E95